MGSELLGSSAMAAESTDLSEKADSVSDVLPEVKSHTALMSVASASVVLALSSKIHDAAWQGDVELLRCCLDEGFSPSAADPDGNTPLHLAAAQGQDAAVQFLLRSRADPRLINLAGQVPLDVVGQDTVAFRLLRTHMSYIEHLQRPHTCLVRFRGSPTYYGAKGNQELRCWFEPESCRIHFKLPAPGKKGKLRRALSCMMPSCASAPKSAHRSVTLPYTTTMNVQHPFCLEINLDAGDERLPGGAGGDACEEDAENDRNIQGVTINMCLASDLKQEVQKMVNIFHTDVIELRNRLEECEHQDAVVAEEIEELEADIAAQRKKLNALVRRGTHASQQQARVHKDEMAALQAQVSALRRGAKGRHSQVTVVASKAIAKLKSQVGGEAEEGVEKHAVMAYERAAAERQLPVLEAYLEMAAAKWGIIADPAARLAAATSPPPKSALRVAKTGAAATSPTTPSPAAETPASGDDSLNFFCVPPAQRSSPNGHGRSPLGKANRPGPSPLGRASNAAEEEEKEGERDEGGIRESASSNFAETLRQWAAAASRAGPPPPKPRLLHPPARPAESVASAAVSSPAARLDQSQDYTGATSMNTDDLDALRLLAASADLTPNSKRRPFVRPGTVPALDLTKLRPSISGETGSTLFETPQGGVDSHQLPVIEDASRSSERSSLARGVGADVELGAHENTAGGVTASVTESSSFPHRWVSWAARRSTQVVDSPGADSEKSLTSTVVLTEKSVPPSELFSSTNMFSASKGAQPGGESPEHLPVGSHNRVRRMVERLSSTNPIPQPIRKKTPLREEPEKCMTPRSKSGRKLHSTSSSMAGVRCSITAKCGAPTHQGRQSTSQSRSSCSPVKPVQPEPIARYPSRYVSGPATSQYYTTARTSSSGCFYSGISDAVAKKAVADTAASRTKPVGGKRPAAAQKRWR